MRTQRRLQKGELSIERRTSMSTGTDPHLASIKRQIEIAQWRLIDLIKRQEEKSTSDEEIRLLTAGVRDRLAADPALFDSYRLPQDR